MEITSDAVDPEGGGTMSLEDMYCYRCEKQINEDCEIELELIK